MSGATELSGPESSRTWKVSSRVIVYAAIGAALYAVTGLLSFILPGTQQVAIRPAFGLVTFFGWAFGPVTGFFTGVAGNALIDQLQGSGLLTYWNWSVANGLVGLFAGLLGRWTRTYTRTDTVGMVAAGVLALLATAIGLLFVITDIPLLGIGFNTFLVQNYIPALVANALPALILTPLLNSAWLPIRRQIGR